MLLHKASALIRCNMVMKLQKNSAEHFQSTARKQKTIAPRSSWKFQHRIRFLHFRASAAICCFGLKPVASSGEHGAKRLRRFTPHARRHRRRTACIASHSAEGWA